MQIAWYDNFPVASWLALGGKCRGCRSPISARYLGVELLTGALFLYAAWRQLRADDAPVAERAALFTLHAAFLSALVVCTFIDLEFCILPDEITVSGILIGIGVAAIFPQVHAANAGALPEVIGNPHLGALAASALGAAVGFGEVWVVGALGKVVFRKRIEKEGETEAMGFGDVKYVAMMGAVLGWKGALLTLFIACIFGAFFGLGRLIVQRRMGYVPFGPFLSAGALVMLFWAPLVYGAMQSYADLFGGGAASP